MIPNLEAAVINQTLEVKPDADGEERKLQADVVLELDMKLYREEKGCTAYSIVESDGIVPQTVAGRIKENPYVHDVMLVLPNEKGEF